MPLWAILILLGIVVAMFVHGGLGAVLVIAGIFVLVLGAGVK